MKKIIYLLSVIFLLLNSRAFCQTINLSSDSVNSLLCKKWQMNYVMMAGMKMGKKLSAAAPNFEFNKGGMLTVSGSTSTKETTGTWSYDKNKKLIKLTLGEKRHLTIITLKENELVMLVDKNQGVPDDVTDLKMVFNVSPN